MATVMKPIAHYMEQAGLSVTQLAKATGLERRIVGAIVNGNYTPSPVQRQRVASALNVSSDDVAWGHAVPVQHLRGNGPQTGRPT